MTRNECCLSSIDDNLCEWMPLVLQNLQANDSGCLTDNWMDFVQLSLRQLDDGSYQLMTTWMVEFAVVVPTLIEWWIWCCLFFGTCRQLTAVVVWTTDGLIVIVLTITCSHYPDWMNEIVDEMIGYRSSITCSRRSDANWMMAAVTRTTVLLHQQDEW